MTPSPPLPSVAELEQRATIDVATLDNDAAVDLGLVAVALLRERGLDLAVEIVLHDVVVFRAMLGGTGRDNDPWLLGKAAVARHFGEPSLLVKLRHLEQGTAFAARDDVDHDVMRAYGGAIPLHSGGAVVGTITVSGAPDVVDDEVAHEALRRFGLASERAD